MKKSQNYRRKLKLDSYDAEYQADSENILYHLCKHYFHKWTRTRKRA